VRGSRVMAERRERLDRLVGPTDSTPSGRTWARGCGVVRRCHSTLRQPTWRGGLAMCTAAYQSMRLGVR
jgi:hypothetical protein